MLVPRKQKQINRDLKQILNTVDLTSDQVEEVVFALQLGVPTAIVRKSIANPKLEPREMKHESLKQYHKLKKGQPDLKEKLRRKELL